MNIYQGTHRRQVGGGVWTTLTRGIRPILLNLLKILKPHAASAANRVAQSATKVGTSMAMDAMQGKFSKERLKDAVKNEAMELTQDASTSIKRKLAQSGKGKKRRRLNPPRTKKERMPIRQCRYHPQKRTQSKRNKRKSKMNKRKPSQGIKRRKTKRKTVSRHALKDIFNS